MNELDELIKKLTEYGEDAAELEMWRNMFPSLDRSEQADVLASLRNELHNLQSAD